MRKTLVLLAFILLVVGSIPAFALDEKQMRDDMYSFAAITAYLDVVMHPGVPSSAKDYAMIGKQLDELDGIKQRLYKQIMSLEAGSEFEKARTVITEFKAMHGFEKEVGHFVGLWLTEREKFLSIQN
ncbi:MAG TPA: hypothetical protein PKO06_18995 [Candidatus Ozemobacteraceae bacterium]|nr:hypothetical protein [Candidatus Ozemobacteraceae bacterium]